MIDLSNISLQFNGKYLFRDVNLKINSGDKICLVGANGTGKSSLLKIVNENIIPENGTVNKRKRISIGYLPQDNVTHKGKTLKEEAKSALTDITFLQAKEKEIVESLSEKNLSEEMNEDLVHQLGEVHHRLEELDSYSADAKVEKILMGLGFEVEDLNRLTDEFSGGWQMRIALAKILISQNDLLLLDEPTNHLDLDSLEWLISYLKSFKGALLIVSHDRHFVNSITSKTIEIFLYKVNIYNGNYDAYLTYKEERDSQLINQHEVQQKKIKETERFIERFRYKATKAKQVQSRIKQLEKMEIVELPDSNSEISVKFPPPPQSGKVNIELKNLFKSYGDKKLFEGINFTINRGEKIAFVGPNGAGKTTLAKIIADVIDFNSGDRITGHNTIISYYAQDVADNLNPSIDLIETLEEVAENKTPEQLRTLLGCFLFSGDDVFKKVAVLSGGEKSRIALAKILLTKSNLIILDEPTNHLDISSKEVLQKALIDFSGTLILVSHDVDFLQPVVNKVVEIRKGIIKEFAGGIEYYFSKREEFIENESKKSKDEKKFSGEISRKDQKRIEAEQRQKKFEVTKDIINRISRFEKLISQHEKREKELEILLTKPEVYSNGKKMKEATSEFNKIKAELEQYLSEWENLSHELNEIEKQFN